MRPRRRSLDAIAYSLEQVVEATEESKAEILRKGVESSVERELRDARIRLDELQEEYDVEASRELESAIERGDVEEHPAGKELI